MQPGAKPERRDVNIIAALRAPSAECRATRGGKVLKKRKAAGEGTAVGFFFFFKWQERTVK